jgi:hypothetical protein
MRHTPTPDGDYRLRTGSALALRVVAHRNYVGSGQLAATDSTINDVTITMVLTFLSIATLVTSEAAIRAT